MKSVHLSISGRVQGIGYRAWLEREAVAAGIAGWVRNRRDGSVEAVISGKDADIDALEARCRVGPPGARVDTLWSQATPMPESSGFRVLPTD